MAERVGGDVDAAGRKTVGKPETRSTGGAEPLLLVKEHSRTLGHASDLTFEARLCSSVRGSVAALA